MKIVYVTLNNAEEARKIGRQILTKQLANCVNFFPINCIYNYEGKIEEEPEVVLIIKTNDSNYDKIRELIKSEIDYVNFIGQFTVDKVNADFADWLKEVVG